jgi:uncharacterized protein
MFQSRIEYLTIGKQELRPGALNPDWIISGEPNIRSAILSRSQDGECFTALWECSEGTFRWNYSFDETLHFLEGSVTFDDGSGVPHIAGPGDVVYFPKGASVIWTVHSRVLKLAVCRSVLPAPLAVPIRWLRVLKRMLFGAKGGEADLAEGFGSQSWMPVDARQSQATGSN